MKSCQQYLTAIHELVDGTLGPLRRAELDLHLEQCDACRALAADLQQIAQAARTLETIPPPDGAWLRVADRLREEGRVAPARSWHAGGSYRVLALAAALVLAAGASLLLLWRGDPVVPDATDAATVPAATRPAELDEQMTLIETHFQEFIEASKRPDSRVSPATTAVLQRNLLVVNQAIAESRAALDADPGNAPASQSLYDALRQKIQFLQDTIALMNVMRQGDAAGAAELIDGGKS